MQVNQPDETSYSGLSTFMKVPLALDPDGHLPAGDALRPPGDPRRP
jgi:hypothetical protein